MDVQHTGTKVATLAPRHTVVDKPDNPWAVLFRDLFHHRSAVLGMMLIGFLVFVALFASVIATHDPLQSMIGQPGEVPPLPRKAPCIPLFGCTEPMHLMGLDLNARDVFSRIVFGSRISLAVGFIALSFADLRVCRRLGR